MEPTSSPKQTELHLGGCSSQSSRTDVVEHSSVPTEIGFKNNPDRVETDVLFSIFPIHLANIASRQKNHEYREFRLRDGVERLWFYETPGPGGDSDSEAREAITHIATIPPKVRLTPGQVPEVPFGIGNKEFNEGKKVSKYGYPLLELYELVKPVTLAELEQWGMSPPMEWLYVKKGVWESRWGEVHGDDKVRKVF